MFFSQNQDNLILQSVIDFESLFESLMLSITVDELLFSTHVNNNSRLAYDLNVKNIPFNNYLFGGLVVQNVLNDNVFHFNQHPLHILN